MSENSPAGQNVGLAVRASDSDTGSLSYRLEGPDAVMFDFITSTGQIRTKRGVTYNREDPECGFVATAVSPTCTYYVTVAAYDGAGGSDAVRLEIGVNDQSEAPSAPTSPTVRATEGEITSLDVSWNPPANAGPPITSYNVQYRRRGSTEDFSSDAVPDTVAGTSTTISGVNANSDNTPWLMRGTRYEVRVQAVNEDGTSLWSSLGTGSTNLGNLEPRFRRRPNTGAANTRNSDFTIPLTIAENASSGSQVGTVAADDGNGDARTYRLSGGDAAVLALFEINESTGQIRTMSALNHEATGCAYDDTADPTVCTYTVTAEVRDGYGPNRERVEEASNAPDDRVTVEISVRDVREPPAAPTVTVTSPTDVTNLIVTWDVPVNTGPDITGYDVEYRQGNAAWSDDNCRGATDTVDNCHDIPTGTTDTTITQLTANTSYSVRVRATNGEGDSGWAMVTGRTNRNRADDRENDAPTFDSNNDSRTVDENTPSGQNIGNAISASAGEEGDSLIYSLEGADRSSFSIDRNTGQIKTRAALNHEDPACEYVSTAQTTECTYNVRVKVVDGQGGSASHNVEIDVTDEDEPPSAPAPPRVTATKDSGLSLEVTWNEPRDTGKPPVTDYNIQYRLYRPSNEPQETFGAFVHTGTETSATITGLEPRTSYEVQVLAVNHEDSSAWSNAGRGTTGASNTRPAFEDTANVVTRNVVENARPGQDVGSPVSATDEDGDRLSYSLSGPDASSFDINRSSGLIRTRSGVTYDFESKPRYSVTVRVDDGQRKANSVAAKSVTINLDNLGEAPSTPNAPRVTGVPGSTDSIRVTWDEPANTGPPITFYNLRYGPAGTGFVPLQRDIVDRSTIITGLEAGTRYEVQVRAHNTEEQSEYSRSGTGAPNADMANRNPRFTGGTRSFSVAEDTGAGEAVGNPVEAIDDDDDPLSYSLAGTDSASFDIDSVSGQIRTREALNFEEKSSHSVTVRARDNRGGSGTVDVRIAVTDVDEPPDTPDAPTVTALSSTSLQVTWDEPGNTGPAITDYDYRYRGPTGDWTEITNTTIRETTATIGGLTPSTFYDVSLRARNAEGMSDWSNSGFGSTNEPGANNPPVFTDGTSATRSVSASAPTGTSIGAPVAATDADSGDTLTYSLEGRDAASFAINETNGQLLTKSGVTLIAGETYTVTVAADDQRDISRITVTINATAAPPNNPPVFREGASVGRSVPRNAPAGTQVGGPVTATDADGDSITYTLEGTNAASFAIDASGQLTTRVALTPGNTYTVTVVASDGKDQARIAVTITVSANNPPVFSGEPRSFRVPRNAPAGTQVGDPVTATDADGDSITYSLEGTNAASFDIDASGQLTTRVALTPGNTYTVTVVASDGEDQARIAVTITVSTNNPPVFSDEPRSFRVPRNAPADSQVGDPVTATDADNDSMTYSLEGTNAASFAIDASGQLTTRVALTPGNTYTVTVVASDGEDQARIAVTITVSTNNPPVFSGEPRSFTVRDNASADTPIGTVTAADADLGDTLTYSLEGTDAASFDIRSNTGQIVTRSGVTLTAGATHTVTVVASDGQETASIAVTINVIQGIFGCATRGAAVSDRSNTGLVSDCEALLTARNAMEGTARLNWSVYTPIGQWEGVYLNGTNGTPIRVKAIILRRRGLDGTIPAELGQISMLTKLNLHSNDLTGSIPTELGDLSRLERLLLHNNRLTGTIPDLGDLRSLEMLWLSGKDMALTGSVPAWLNEMSNLESVSLWGNELSGPIPCLTGMTSLKLLKLQSNQLNGGVPACLGDLSSTLGSLYIHLNPLGGTIPRELGQLTSLRRLWIHSSDLTGPIPPELGNMAGLWGLNLRDNNLGGPIPTELGRMTNMRKLRLHNNGLRGSIPTELRDLSNLTDLWLSGNDLSGPIPSELGSLDNLKQLSLKNNGLSGDIPPELGNLTDTLTHVFLAGNIGLTGCVPAGLADVTNNDIGDTGLNDCNGN